MPQRGFSVLHTKANSGNVVLPRQFKPVESSWRTYLLCFLAGRATKAPVPCCVGYPARGSLSLMNVGTPYSRPSLGKVLPWRASSYARTTIALSAGFTRSARWMAAAIPTPSIAPRASFVNALMRVVSVVAFDIFSADFPTPCAACRALGLKHRVHRIYLPALRPVSYADDW